MTKQILKIIQTQRLDVGRLLITDSLINLLALLKVEYQLEIFEVNGCVEKIDLLFLFMRFNTNGSQPEKQNNNSNSNPNTFDLNAINLMMNDEFNRIQRIAMR